MNFFSSNVWTGQNIERHFPNAGALVCDIDFPLSLVLKYSYEGVYKFGFKSIFGFF